MSVTVRVVDGIGHNPVQIFKENGCTCLLILFSPCQPGVEDTSQHILMENKVHWIWALFQTVLFTRNMLFMPSNLNMLFKNYICTLNHSGSHICERKRWNGLVRRGERVEKVHTDKIFWRCPTHHSHCSSFRWFHHFHRSFFFLLFFGCLLPDFFCWWWELEILCNFWVNKHACYWFLWFCYF